MSDPNNTAILNAGEVAPSSGPGLITEVSATPIAVAFSLPGGATYDMEYSTDLVTWTVIAINVTGIFDDTNGGRTQVDSGFYRGVVK